MLKTCNGDHYDYSFDNIILNENIPIHKLVAAGTSDHDWIPVTALYFGTPDSNTLDLGRSLNLKTYHGIGQVKIDLLNDRYQLTLDTIRLRARSVKTTRDMYGSLENRVYIFNDGTIFNNNQFCMIKMVGVKLADAVSMLVLNRDYVLSDFSNDFYHGRVRKDKIRWIVNPDYFNSKTTGKFLNEMLTIVKQQDIEIYHSTSLKNDYYEMTSEEIFKMTEEVLRGMNDEALLLYLKELIYDR